MPPCHVGQVRFSGSPRRGPRYRIVDLHIQLRIVFDGLSGLRIEALGPVQVIDVLRAFDELSVRAIQRVEEAVAAEMADHLAGLAVDDRVVEHVDADLVVVPRIVRACIGNATPVCRCRY